MRIVVHSVAVTVAVLLLVDAGAAQRATSRRTPAPPSPSASRVPPRDPVSPRARVPRASAQSTPATARARVSATTRTDLLAWNTYVSAEVRTGALRVRSVGEDPALPFRRIERLQQYHQGVPVWGGEIVRDFQAGAPVAIFGELASGLTLDTRPAVPQAQAEQQMLTLAGADAFMLQGVELTIVQAERGDQRLAYTALMSTEGNVIRLFLDATSGVELLRYSEIQTQAVVGTGTGVLGDAKKLSVLQESGTFRADDQHRPPVLKTFDFRNILSRARSVIETNGALLVSDIAGDTDNRWTDPAVVDAHVHVGWTYDYLFKRFNRHGLDDRERPISILVNAVTQQEALTISPSSPLSLYTLNAFWCGVCGPGQTGTIFFGNGIPPNFSLSGQNFTYFAGALDIAAHELTHGVIDSSSRLISGGESGALNEAFADIIGTSVEFFYHPSGVGTRRADYVLGEDVVRAVNTTARDGTRSMADPGLFRNSVTGTGNPDHYSRRYTGPLDDGGEHINSGIVSHAFYLAVEGGTNRTSGLGVQGVGAANRAQIERVFYRAFVFLLPSSATFSTARAATIQAARDLYGANSAAEQAVTQAWTAVGVS